MSNLEKPQAICVIVLNTFRSPLTNRLTKVGEKMNVPRTRFWFNRLNDHDVEVFKFKKPKAETKIKKGSK